MKKVIILSLGILVSAALGAQTLQTAYFSEDFSYSYRLNPAFHPDHSFVGLPFIGMTSGTYKGDFSLNDLFFKKGGESVTFMNPGVSSSEFLGELKQGLNKISAEHYSTLAAVGFKAGGLYNIVDVSLRNLGSAKLPYDLGRFLKDGASADGNYDLSGLNARATTFFELGITSSWKVARKLTVGMRFKGVIGIVASRLTEHYYRPAIVLTSALGFASGSARSIQGFDVYSAINSCRDIIENFGGHTYAAGLTLKEEKIPELTERIERWVEEHITDVQQRQHLDIDMEVKFNDVTPRLYKSLRVLSPYGPGNQKPMFVVRRIKDQGRSRLVGKEQEHIRLELIDPVTNFTHNGIAFNQASKFELVKSGKPFDIVFTIEENTFSKNNIQLLVKDIRESESNNIAAVLSLLIRNTKDDADVIGGMTTNPEM